MVILPTNPNIVPYTDQEFPEDLNATQGFGRGIVSKLAFLERLQVKSMVDPSQEGLYLHSFCVEKKKDK